jgi:hypothetical protein
VAIQSATALNAYLNAAPAAPLDAGISAPQTSSEEGTPAQGSASDRLGTEQRSSSRAVTEPGQDATDEAHDASSRAQAGLPALYGRNARSVAGGMRAGSISLIA